MQNRKRIGVTLLATGLAFSMMGCSGKTADSVKTIQEAGVLKVAIVDSENYYTNMEGDQPVGMEPELAATIASALGVTTEYQVLSQDAAVEAVNSGTADIALGCIAHSVKLAENYRLTTSYGKGFHYVVTKRGDYAQSASAFANSSVGIHSNLGEQIKSQMNSTEGIILKDYANAATAAEDIKSGKIRAYVCGEEDAKALLADENLQVQNLFHVDAAEYVIVAGKEDQTLVNGMNTLIAQFLLQ